MQILNNHGSLQIVRFHGYKDESICTAWPSCQPVLATDYKAKSSHTQKTVKKIGRSHKNHSKDYRHNHRYNTKYWTVSTIQLRETHIAFTGCATSGFASFRTTSQLLFACLGILTTSIAKTCAPHGKLDVAIGFLYYLGKTVRREFSATCSLLTDGRLDGQASILFAVKTSFCVCTSH